MINCGVLAHAEGGFAKRGIYFSPEPYFHVFVCNNFVTVFVFTKYFSGFCAFNERTAGGLDKKWGRETGDMQQRAAECMTAAVWTHSLCTFGALSAN